MADVVTKGGVRIPKIGCGTYPMRGPVCAEIVAEALRAGFRHVDTAQGYDNEAAVGEGILMSGVPRERIFITTKVRPQVIGDGPLQRSVEESLKRLKTDVIDLLLIHWPNPEVQVAESMRALSATKRAGLTRAIGVSNFVIAKLDEAIEVSPEPIAAVQFEYHPYLDQTRLLAAARRHGLAIIAYCPIALGKVASDPRLAAIGKTHGKSAGAGDAPVADPAGRRDCHPENVEARAAQGESRRFRLSIDRGGNGSDKPDDGAQFPADQRAAMGAALGLTKRTSGLPASRTELFHVQAW